MSNDTEEMDREYEQYLTLSRVLREIEAQLGRPMTDHEMTAFDVDGIIPIGVVVELPASWVISTKAAETPANECEAHGRVS